MIKEQFEILKKSDAAGHINALTDHYITIDKANQLFFERGVPGYTALLNGVNICNVISKELSENDDYEALVFFSKIKDLSVSDFANLKKENINLKEIIKKLEEKRV